jgi:hypothetical protein
MVAGQSALAGDVLSADLLGEAVRDERHAELADGIGDLAARRSASTGGDIMRMWPYSCFSIAGSTSRCRRRRRAR